MERLRDPRPRETPPTLDYGRYRPSDSQATFDLLIGTVCAVVAALGLFAYAGGLFPRIWSRWPLLACVLLGAFACRGLWRALRR